LFDSISAEVILSFGIRKYFGNDLFGFATPIFSGQKLQ